MRRTLWAMTLSSAMLSLPGGAYDQVRMANEGSIGDRWMLADGSSLAVPGYPAAFADRGDNVCVAVGYSIRPDGATSDFALLKIWSSSAQDQEPVPGFWDAFTQASAHALSQWKFKPRPEVSRPEATYTVATMHFMGKEATDVAGLRSKCAIKDLATFVQQQKSDRFINGEDKHDLDRLRRREDELQMARASARARAIFENDSR